VLWSEHLEGGDHSEDLDVDGRMALEWKLYKYGGKLWTGFSWSLVYMVMKLNFFAE
jgi:hypothetical protein